MPYDCKMYSIIQFFLLQESFFNKPFYIWRGDLTEGFLRYRIGGLIFGGAYFRNFTVI